MPDAAFEVAPGRAEPEIGQQFFDEQVQRAPIGIGVADHLRGDAAQRIQVENEELDRGVDADRAEQPSGDRAEVGLEEFRVGQLGDLGGEALLDQPPERHVVDALAEPARQVVNGPVDAFRVEVEPLDDVALGAGPVEVLEALRRTPADRAEFPVVVGEFVDDDPGATLRQGHLGCGRAFGSQGRCGGLQPMFRIRTSPNSLHLTSVAPSMRRAKS